VQKIAARRRGCDGLGTHRLGLENTWGRLDLLVLLDSITHMTNTYIKLPNLTPKVLYITNPYCYDPFVILSLTHPS
jgi:hypothetical protein